MNNIENIDSEQVIIPQKVLRVINSFAHGKDRVRVIAEVEDMNGKKCVKEYAWWIFRQADRAKNAIGSSQWKMWEDRFHNTYSGST